jgi:uncharacterized protein YmfQ (DUF2313 family)
MALNAKAYLQQLQALLPRGLAWPRAVDAHLTKLLSAFSLEFARVDQRVDDLLDEADPRSTLELLPEWERMAGLPDPCASKQTITLGPGVYTFETSKIASFNRDILAYQKSVSGQLLQVATDAIRSAVAVIDRNLLLYSSQFEVTNIAGTSVAVWARSNILAINANAAIGPDGTMTADVMIPNTGSGAHYIDQQIQGWGDETVVFGFADLAPNGYDWAFVQSIYKNGSGGGAFFNLATGEVGTVSQGAGNTNVTAEIQPLPNGFYRCTVKGMNVKSGGTVPRMRIYAAASGSSTTFAGDGVSGILVARAKYGVGTDIGEYLETGMYPAYTFETSGTMLIEAAATNYITNSKDGNQYTTKSGMTYSANSVTAPDGTLTADAYRETAVSGGHYIERNVGLAADKNQCYSVYLQPVGGRSTFFLYMYANGFADNVSANINTSSGRVVSASAGGAGSLQVGHIEELADGWWRIAVAGKPSSAAVTDLKLRVMIVNGSTTYAGDVEAGFNIWISQLEDGLGPPSSPIETDTFAITRAADKLSIFLEQSLEQRRNALVAKLTQLGGQSRQYFIDLAAALGYEITITEFQPFTVNSGVNDPLCDTEWRFVWQVNASQDTIRRFSVQSGVNDPLASWGNDQLECVINRLKPAHTIVLFAYQ